MLANLKPTLLNTPYNNYNNYSEAYPPKYYTPLITYT